MKLLFSFLHGSNLKFVRTLHYVYQPLTIAYQRRNKNGLTYDSVRSRVHSKQQAYHCTQSPICCLLHISVHARYVEKISSDNMVRILNVAEKNDAAKSLADIMSRGGYVRSEGFSVYNKLYEFDFNLNGQRCHMVMTSVSGHLLNYAFNPGYKNWQSCNPLQLFDAPVSKTCIEGMELIKRTLEREARLASRLIIWTDCDREGENIGFEVINVCKAIKPTLPVQRAKFSEITFQSVHRALQNLAQPDERQSVAVDVRSELDLRIGAAFTRFQTLRLQKVFPEALADTLISYGSCQFPTLGFVVERYKAIEQFIPEKFWKIKVTHNGDEGTIDFHWKRVRLFDELACTVLFEQCQDDPQATVTNVTTKNKSKWRPLPLDTVELEKLASRKLRINAKEAMRIAERLYTQGFISYPRTETNIFPKELSLSPLVEMQTADPSWGEFAARVMEVGPNPRQGKKSDQAHPPIHPTKYASNLQGDEKKLYEFIVRHFLACVSKDAQGLETIVEIEIAGELFTANGLIIVERNYLEVYPYDRWSDKVMPHYTLGQVFMPTSLDMVDGETSPPNLLTEADLIALMEKHGIGTDATHAEHIETIKSRMYVGLQDHHFVPGQLGMGLVEGYDAMGFEMSKPHLRAELEADLKRICDGVKDPRVVLEEQIAKYRHVFEESLRQAEKIDTALAQFLNEQPQRPSDDSTFPDLSLPTPVCKCSACGCDIILKQKRNEPGFMLSCQGFPNCRLCIWFPKTVLSVTVSEDSCTQCAGSPKKLLFKFKPRSYMPYIPDEYETCIGGCDPDFLETLDIRPITSQNRNGVQGTQERPRATNSSNDSGYSSQQNTLSNRNQTRIVFGRNNSNNTVNSSFNNRTQNSSHPNDYRQNTATNSQTHSQSYNNSYNNPNSFAFSGAGTQNTNNNRSVNNNVGHSTSYSRPSWNGSGNTERENAIVCTCNEDAILLTVRKEGPNTGRQFYKCAKPQGTGCNFFLWADEGDNVGDDGGVGASSSGRGNNFGQGRGSSNLSFTQNSSWNSRRVDSGFGGGSTYEDSVQCNCGIPAKRLTVQKEGPNKGREFYGCMKERNVQCRFFKWADEVEGDQQSGYGNYSTNTGFGGGRGGTRQRNTGAAGRKRKCGACGEEGHDRRNCPGGGS